jgi:tRNA1(Val) A37 N6-methylase TrmN6
MTLLTHDSISLRGAGIVTITQPAKGHRFTLDSILLADFCRIKRRDRILEPGAGTGIISLLLAKKFPKSTLCPLEVQPELAELCGRNIVDNNLQDRVTPVGRDLRYVERSVKRETFDMIVANPPFAKAGTGKISPLPARRAARHEGEARLEQWLDLQKMLKNRGRYCLVFTAHRLDELIALMKSRRLGPKRIRFVHPRPDKPASLVLIEAVKGAGTGSEILPPLFVHEEDGGYTNEMKEIYGL